MSEIALGLLLGGALVLALRAGQIWRNRGMGGLSPYRADLQRRRLLGWVAIIMVGAAAAGVLVVREMRPPADLFTAAEVPVTEAPTDSTLQAMTLSIPALGIETTFVSAPIVAGQWDVSGLREEVAHLEGTAYPGQPGNAVVAGHITIPGAGWGPFQELETLNRGDLIFVRQGDDTVTYEVIEQATVSRRAVEVTHDVGDDRLTLLTCTGWNDHFETYFERIVVVARMMP